MEATGKFLSTPSLRRATEGEIAALIEQENFYPRPPCGGRQAEIKAHVTRILISIHALLAEGDVLCDWCFYDCLISIHALLAEGDSKSVQKLLSLLHQNIKNFLL